MFTGIIEELGSVRSLKKIGQSYRGVFVGNVVLEETRIGDSIAINGVCQTVVSLSEGSFSVDISETTLNKTTMGILHAGDIVNLERAVKLSDRMGGHLVQGHVNYTSIVENIKTSGEMFLLSFKVPESSIKYFIEEGSVAVDGISLTICEIDKKKSSISIQVIPHTFENTILKYKKKGDKINIETDMVGRFIESFIMPDSSRTITKSKLIQWGY
jgi:riboflavin synthase